MHIIPIVDTYAKVSPVDSTQLSPEDLIFCKAGEKIEVNWDRASDNNHVEVELATPQRGRFNWHFWKGAVEVEGTEEGNKPQDDPAPAADRGKLLKFPGFSGNYGVNEPIIAGGHFTWGEATHGGSRIPVSINVVHGMIRVAKAMEEIRSRLGDRPIRVTSWYRDPVTNRRVGGASKSRHLVGDAVDFSHPDFRPSEMYRRLDGWWGTRGGLAWSDRMGFLHIDCRGYSARWLYG